MASEIIRAADAAQYARPAIPEEQRGQIRVRLLNATPDPLGSVAALCAQYEGRVIRSLSEVTDEERRACLDDMGKTVLNGPLEAAQFHWQIEGVTRSITHQMVRSRASFFAQESLRFAVPEGDWAEEIPLPPSLAHTKGGEALGAESSQAEYARNLWDENMRNAARTYAGLIDCGVPAEEARGVLPHDMPTRIHWVMDLRTLLAEAGKRTCTQAQFPWRIIFAGMAQELRRWARERDAAFERPVGAFATGFVDENGSRHYTNEPLPKLRKEYGPAAFQEFTGGASWAPEDGWQFREIAKRLRPVCFQTGSCGFMAAFDRSCKIRERVDAFTSAGVPPSGWGERYQNGAESTIIEPIHDFEWAADPSAARS